MGDYHSRRESTTEHRGEFTMEQNRASPELQRWEAASNDQRGKDSKQNCHGSTPLKNVSMWKRPKCPKVTEMTHFKTPGQNRGGEWPSGTPTMQRHLEPHYNFNRSLFFITLHPITSSSALDTGLAALLQEISPLALYKERLADRKSSRPSTLSAELLWELCEEFVNNLNSVLWHFIKIDSFQDPSSDYSKRQKLTPFKTLCNNIYGKMSQFDLFQDPCVFTLELTPFKTPGAFGHKSTHFNTPSSELSQR